VTDADGVATRWAFKAQLSTWQSLFLRVALFQDFKNEFGKILERLDQDAI
jgi:hypothetical protein